MTEKSPLERARETLRASLPEAAEVLVKALRDKDGRVSYRAALEILNRAGITTAGTTEIAIAERKVGGRKATVEEEYTNIMDSFV
jgi:hypothetical protein